MEIFYKKEISDGSIEQVLIDAGKWIAENKGLYWIDSVVVNAYLESFEIYYRDK